MRHPNIDCTEVTCRRASSWRNLFTHAYELFSVHIISFYISYHLIHTTIGCGKQGFPSAQPYLSHTPLEL
ncbi:hypothetical protein N7457_001098 [Penicillium paradoxum]|uniref:uncharacterized protein n=1 Tax=Penicillium paradoxum TaxID=176176 RepID=UPI0025499E56|nr:uncharacterized protein N7457_001098 [Penicillium paradoxum]KAJ5794499.1 hypothetical protein N7457_001098 [Penicillium paradoxum]